MILRRLLKDMLIYNMINKGSSRMLKADKNTVTPEKPKFWIKFESYFPFSKTNKIKLRANNQFKKKQKKKT